MGLEAGTTLASQLSTGVDAMTRKTADLKRRGPRYLAPIRSQAARRLSGIPAAREVPGILAERAQGFVFVLRVGAMLDPAVAHADKPFEGYRSTRELRVGPIGC